MLEREMTINEICELNAPDLVDKHLAEAGIDDLTPEEREGTISDFRTWIRSLLPNEFGPKIVEIANAYKAKRNKPSL